jgi:hypothetical protein
MQTPENPTRKFPRHRTKCMLTLTDTSARVQHSERRHTGTLNITASHDCDTAAASGLRRVAHERAEFGNLPKICKNLQQDSLSYTAMAKQPDSQWSDITLAFQQAASGEMPSMTVLNVTPACDPTMSLWENLSVRYRAGRRRAASRQALYAL